MATPSLRSLGLTFALVTFAAIPDADAQVTNTSKCLGGKLKALAKAESSYIGCYAKVTASGDQSKVSDCLSKTQGTLSAKFASLTTCSGTVDECDPRAVTCLVSVALGLPDVGPNPCEAAKLKAAAKAAKGRLGCYAKATIKGLPVDVACLAKADAKYAAAFAKAGATCTGDMGVVDALLDNECVTPIVGTNATVTSICGTSGNPVTGIRVFVTQGTYTGGQVGGLAGADAKCTQEAQAAGLTGSFKAWLSDSTTSAASRLIHQSVPYVMVEGTQVADDWTDFTDGSHDAALTKNASGAVVSPGGVWTGTTASGQIYDVNATCANWTSDAAAGSDGYCGGQPQDWSVNSVVPVDGCTSANRLYCIEDSGTSSAVCGNGVKEGTEQCDGADATACPGQCQGNCTCSQNPTCIVTEDSAANVCSADSQCCSGQCDDFGEYCCVPLGASCDASTAGLCCNDANDYARDCDGGRCCVYEGRSCSVSGDCCDGMNCVGGVCSRPACGDSTFPTCGGACALGYGCITAGTMCLCAYYCPAASLGLPCPPPATGVCSPFLPDPGAGGVCVY